jgi:hypothetical protein
MTLRPQGAKWRCIGQVSKWRKKTSDILTARAAVEDDLHQSLRLLRTDYVDLLQFHQVSQETDYQTLTGPNGALEGVIRAQEAGEQNLLKEIRGKPPAGLAGLQSAILLPLECCRSQSISRVRNWAL